MASNALRLLAVSSAGNHRRTNIVTANDCHRAATIASLLGENKKSSCEASLSSRAADDGSIRQVRRTPWFRV